MSESKRYIIHLSEEEFRQLIREIISEIVEQQSPEDPSSDLMTMKEVAKHFKVSLVTIHKWRKFKLLPQAIKKGGRVYFLRSQIISSTIPKNHETR